jgi:hypothetical protein
MTAIKESGLNWSTLSVDDAAGTPVDIRNDISNLQWSTPRGVQDVTGIDKSAYERLLLLADFSMTLTGVGFDDQASQAHTTFKTVPSTSVQRTVAINISGQTLSTECIATDYGITRGNDGAMTWSVPLVLGNGVVPTWS